MTTLNGIGMSRAQSYVVDRREGRRYKLNWPVRVKGIDSASAYFEEVATLQALSSSGAYVYLAACPPVGSRLSVRIRLPLKKEVMMTYSATVVRVEKKPSGVGVALKFDTSRPDFE